MSDPIDRSLGAKIAVKIYNIGKVPLAIRLGALAEYLLSRHTQEKLAAKTTSPLRYVTMAGRAHWLLLRESLVSLHRSWQSIPRLIVVSDGSWGKKEFVEAFRFWPEPIEILMPDDITVPLLKEGQTELAQLAANHPLGLKLAAILYMAKEEQILFVDSDILWFSDPKLILSEFRDLPGPTTSVESGYSYNEALIRRHCPNKFIEPHPNTGLVYLKGKLCSFELLQDMLMTALEQPKHPFNEQTIIAIAVNQSGRRFPDEFCLVYFDDAFALRRRKPWREGFHSRHYVHWMRHQFYRDALRLRVTTYNDNANRQARNLE